MRRTSAALTLVALSALACASKEEASDTAAAATSTAAATATPPAGTATGAAGDSDQAVSGGGIAVAGWQGKTDKKDASINDSRFATANGGNIDVKTGPAGIFWNPSNTASGNYEIKATFTERKQNADHPHAYGLFIGGSDLDTDNQAYAYCIAYGDGSYSVKYFNGAKVTNVVNREQSPAVRKADASGTATNEVGWRVRGGNASCVINGQEVKSWPAAQLTGAGKLKSLDGTYGVRVSHNIDVSMSPIAVTKL